MKNSSNIIKQVLIFLALLSVPALVFLNLSQAFAYSGVKESIAEMEKEQKDWLELNKRMIANLAIYSSPARLDRLAGEDLGLSKEKGETHPRLVLRPRRE